MGTTAAPASVAGAAFGGRLMGGQQPVVGAVVTVRTIGKQGYGVAGQPLGSTVTDEGGNYSFPAGYYTCPSPSTLILLTARGGNPGLPGAVNNTAIFLAAFAGYCGNLTASTVIEINEVTTVAAAYVLRPFMTGSNVGTSASNPYGPEAAFDTYSNLVNNETGLPPGPLLPDGLIVPTARMYALANSVAACINTDGPSSTPCTKLLAYGGEGTSGSALNTFAALGGILSYPDLNVAPIYALAGAKAPFASTLSAAPPDWSLPLTYTAGYLSTPTVGLDIDQFGDVFVATRGGFAGTVEVIDDAGNLFTNGFLNGTVDHIAAIAADPDGGFLVTSDAAGDPSVIHYDFAGKVSINTNVTTPVGAVFSGKNTSAILFPLDPPGVLTSYLKAAPQESDFVGGGFTTLAYGPNKLFYLAGGNNSNVVVTGLSGGFGNAAYNLNAKPNCSMTFSHDNAICAAPNGPHNTFIYAYSQADGTKKTAYSFDIGLNGNGEVDGDGALWLPTTEALSSGPRAYRFAPADSSPTVISHVGASEDEFAQYNALRIDFAGNVWLTTLSGGLYELVGAAAPTSTPLAINAVKNSYGVRP